MSDKDEKVIKIGERSDRHKLFGLISEDVDSILDKSFSDPEEIIKRTSETKVTEQDSDEGVKHEP